MDHPFLHIATAKLEILNALQAYVAADLSPEKADLMLGVYQTEEGRPYVLPSVKLARRKIFEDPSWDHEYPSSHLGEEGFRLASTSLLFGEQSDILKKGRVASMQALGASGACHMGAAFLARHYQPKHIQGHQTVYIPKETWVNHPNVFQYEGFATADLPYFDVGSRKVDMPSLLTAIDELPLCSIVVLQVCGNNPTGCDPCSADWENLARSMLKGGHLAFLDVAYMGFVSGDVDTDCRPIRLFAEKGIPMLVAATWGKAFGLYGERVGHLCITTPSREVTDKIEKQMKLLARAETGAQPRFGARIFSEIMLDPQLRLVWREDVDRIAKELARRRTKLWSALKSLNPLQDWNYVKEQRGMFLYTGFSTEEVRLLREEHHVYLQDTGRLSIAGLNKENIWHVAQSMDAMARKKECQSSGPIETA